MTSEEKERIEDQADQLRFHYFGDAEANLVREGLLRALEWVLNDGDSPIHQLVEFQKNRELPGGGGGP